ncbi:class I SAM-dependent methyltransferase [Brevibacillus sp. B_LB10_24]|uniref:class I SAM-dependent methyltransferase n=1 Tax=Brevibacillus sp. B_LB10_24 TaxID=3380645 RepID=UPI0038B92FF5
MADARHRPGNYGIDAPNVVRNLLLLGIGCLVLGVVSFYVFPEKWLWLGVAIGMVLFIAFLILLIESLYMIWSSKVGKYRMREKLLDFIQLRGDELLLDAGCGRGLVLIAAARRLTTGKAYGIDIWSKRDQSGNEPEVTRENARVEGVAERVEVLNGDMRAIPFPDGYFDAVVSSLAVHNISNLEERRRVLGEMMRVLKPGGRLAILDFQHVRQYADALRELEALDVHIYGPYWSMFPPVRIVAGRKK